MPGWQGRSPTSWTSALPSFPKLSWGNKHCICLWEQQRNCSYGKDPSPWRKICQSKGKFCHGTSSPEWEVARWRASSVNSVGPTGEKFESSKNRAAVLWNKPMSLFYLVVRQLSFMILADLTRSTCETHKTPGKWRCRQESPRSCFCCWWWGGSGLQLVLHTWWEGAGAGFGGTAGHLAVHGHPHQLSSSCASTLRVHICPACACRRKMRALSPES